MSVLGRCRRRGFFALTELDRMDGLPTDEEVVALVKRQAELASGLIAAFRPFADAMATAGQVARGFTRGMMAARDLRNVRRVEAEALPRTEEGIRPS